MIFRKFKQFNCLFKIFQIFLISEHVQVTGLSDISDIFYTHIPYLAGSRDSSYVSLDKLERNRSSKMIKFTFWNYC